MVLTNLRMEYGPPFEALLRINFRFCADTIRRRMMMTSGGGVKYKGSIDCGMQILKNEGFMSMMKGAGANILRGVAGAGVLAGFDKFQAMYIAWRLG